MKVFKINYSFYLLFLFIMFSPKQYIVFKLLFCVMIHELGHIIPILLFKYKMKKLEVSIFGFFMELDKCKKMFYKDIIIYFGGIIFNVLCFLIFKDIDIKNISLLLTIVNIIPIYPLDGYNIFNTILCRFIPYYISLIISKILSVIVLVLISIFMIIEKIDLFIYINLVYLICLNIYVIFNIKNIYHTFLLDRYLYNYTYKKKNIKFRLNFQYYFYKYNTIFVFLNEKYIPETELLRILFEKT